MKKIIFLISRFFLAAVFITSGFVKAVDPMGTAIKFEEYFAIAFKLPQLTFLSLPLSFLMCAAEMWIGLMLLLNIAPRLYGWLATGFMIIFTPLTLYLAVANPITDCGCFGDAIKFTNWETFWKNVIIDFFVIAYLLTVKEIKCRFSCKSKIIVSTASYLLVILFELYNYSYLPIIDFMPYKVGNNIPQLMTIPEDAPKDEYQIVLTYKNNKTGEIKEFTDENYPWEDTNWHWLETKTKLVKKGYIPPIHDFVLLDTLGQDHTQELLQHQDSAIIVVTYTFETATVNKLRKTIEFAKKIASKRNNVKIYVLTSSNNATIHKFINQIDFANSTICKNDQVTSKTMLRSNPGIILIKNGTILNKLHYNSLTDRNLNKILGNK